MDSIVFKGSFGVPKRRLESTSVTGRRGPLRANKSHGADTVRGRHDCTHKALSKYIRGLTVGQGQGAGSPFRLLAWEDRFLRGAFDRDVLVAALSLGRGNGKTSLAAAIASAALNGPLMKPASEVVLVAASFGQALIAFRHVLRFMSPALADKRAWRVQDSANAASIERRDTGTILRCIGSDPARAHGLAPSLVIADEPSQWPRAQSDKMRAALETALGKIAGARLIALGTRPADSDHWFARMLAGGADYAQCHAADPDADPFRVSQWHAANPSLRAWPELRRVIESEAKKARRDAGLSGVFQSAALESRHGGFQPALAADRAIDLAADRGRRGSHAVRCAWGDRSRRLGCAICGCSLLSGNRAA